MWSAAQRPETLALLFQTKMYFSSFCRPCCLIIGINITNVLFYCLVLFTFDSVLPALHHRCGLQQLNSQFRRHWLSSVSFCLFLFLEKREWLTSSSGWQSNLYFNCCHFFFFFFLTLTPWVSLFRAVWGFAREVSGFCAELCFSLMCLT